MYNISHFEPGNFKVFYILRHENDWYRIKMFNLIVFQKMRIGD